MKIYTFIVTLSTVFFFIFLNCQQPVINKTYSNNNTGTVTGIVKWPGTSGTNLPLFPDSQATIKMISNGTFVKTVNADLNGMFTFTNLAPGNYSFVFSDSFNSCNDVSVNAAVQENATTNLATNNFNCVLVHPDFAKKKWTILVYFDASGGLFDNTDKESIRYLENIGSTDSDNLNIIAFLLNSDGSRYYYLKKPDHDVSPDIYSSYYDYNTSSIDSGSYKTLENFLNTSIALYPSDNYMLILSGDGSGIDIASPPKTSSINESVCINVSPKNEIRIPELSGVMERISKVHPINILAFEACYMGMFEIAYQLKDSNIDNLVFSEAAYGGRLLYDQGWVSGIANGTLTTAKDISKNIVDELYPSYLTLSAINMNQLSAIALLYNSLASSLNNYSPMQNIRNILPNCQKFASGTNDLQYNYFDLRQFCQILVSNGIAVSDAQALADSLQVGDNNFILRNKYNSSLPNSNGITSMIYDPTSNPAHYSPDAQGIYRGLKYYLDGNTDWDSFLSKLSP